MSNKPSKVWELVKIWVERQSERKPEWPIHAKDAVTITSPSYRTVLRYMKRFEKYPPMPPHIRKEFYYPRDMKYVGWEHGRIPLECLRYYSKRFEIRPSIGLVRWFCRMVEARESDELIRDTTSSSAEANQIGLFAEIFWFNDLIETMGKPTQNLISLELHLAWKTWKADADHTGYAIDARSKGVDPDDTHMLKIKKDYWLLLADLPTLLGTYSQENDDAEPNQDPDFNWYRDDVLKRFTDSKKESI